jgi:hypothetical protein
MTPEQGAGPMKASVAAAILTAVFVSACAQIATQQTATNVKTCLAQAMATPDGELVYRRMWRGDGTDNASKLSDPKGCTGERAAAPKGRVPLGWGTPILLQSIFVRPLVHFDFPLRSS